MADYNLVDSEQLDRAVQATADAIKTKGETTEKIPWNKDTGFKDAVLAIQSGGEKPQLIVTAPEGSTITATNGEETVTGEVGSEGVLTLDLPAFGTWTVTATLDGQEASASVYIEQEYPVSLSYLTTFTINGGHGETVTAFYNGESIDSVQLDSTGTGKVDLNSVGGKTITFTGGLSGYSIAVDVGDAREMTVNVYPDGALYWYGREFVDKTGGWSANNVAVSSGVEVNALSIKKNTSDIVLAQTGERVGAAFSTAKAVDISGKNYTTAFFDVSFAKSNNAAWGLLSVHPDRSTVRGAAEAFLETDMDDEVIPLDISLLSGNCYVTIGLYHQGTATIRRVWLA